MPTSEPIGPGARPAAAKTQEDLAREWDAVADARFAQLRDHRDITYASVLVPIVLRLTDVRATDRVVDAGCGSGFLSALIADAAAHVIGVDPSPKQISLAKAHNGRANVDYIDGTLERFAASNPERADLVVAHMTLMDAPSLGGFLSAARVALRPGGVLVATLTHPWFWPQYWGYDSAPWFHYSDEILIEAPFVISLDDQPIGTTTHIHRPISTYLTTLVDTGFELQRVCEPMPTSEVERLYPKPWANPRYIALRALAS
jgi:SAM-dependent methyltransferase